MTQRERNRIITRNQSVLHNVQDYVMRNQYIKIVKKKSKAIPVTGPPLWPSGQISWLQIRRPGLDSRHYQKKVVGLERGPLSLVSTTEELLYRKVAAPV
jgi:hypothetical protein